MRSRADGDHLIGKRYLTYAEPTVEIHLPGAPISMPPERLSECARISISCNKFMEYFDPDQGLHVRAVSTAVNSVANNCAQLIEPITLGEPETHF